MPRLTLNPNKAPQGSGHYQYIKRHVLDTASVNKMRAPRFRGSVIYVTAGSRSFWAYYIRSIVSDALV